MKLTVEQLRRIIKEEVESAIDQESNDNLSYFDAIEKMAALVKSKSFHRARKTKEYADLWNIITYDGDYDTETLYGDLSDTGIISSNTARLIAETPPGISEY